jgi:hypothetical protein
MFESQNAQRRRAEYDRSAALVFPWSAQMPAAKSAIDL